MKAKLKVGFLGAGKMATALAKGFVASGLVDLKNLVASDVVASARNHFAAETGGKALASNAEVMRSAQVVFVAVKPVQVVEVLREIDKDITASHLLISIAAGIPLKRLAENLPAHARTVRVMPNTPALVGASASAYALGKNASPEDGQLVQQLLGAVGMACPVPEHLLDAVTGLSGSGPAYVFNFIEAMSDGGVAAGLPREVAIRLAAQTVIGAGRMVLETGLHPGALKDQVTSPGGTTIEGIHELEKGGMRGIVMNAVRAATEKSKKLGQA